MPIDASIPLQVRPPTLLNPLDLANAQSAMQRNRLVDLQMQEQQQKTQRLNALSEITSAPDSVDPKTGALTPNAISRWSRLDPSGAAGYIAKATEAEKDRVQALRTRYQMLSDQEKDRLAAAERISAEAKLRRDQVLKETGNPNAANQAGTEVFQKYREKHRIDGAYGPDWEKIPSQYDDAQVIANLGNPMLQWLKQDRSLEAADARQERSIAASDARQLRGLAAIAARAGGGEKPLTDIAKLKADLAAGRISQEDYEAEVADKRRARRDAQQADDISRWRAENPMMAAGMPPAAAKGEVPFHEWKARQSGGAKPAGKFIVDKVYEDAKGNRARYKADGTWEPVK